MLILPTYFYPVEEKLSVSLILENNGQKGTMHKCSDQHQLFMKMLHLWNWIVSMVENQVINPLTRDIASMVDRYHWNSTQRLTEPKTQATFKPSQFERRGEGYQSQTDTLSSEKENDTLAVIPNLIDHSTIMFQ